MLLKQTKAFNNQWSFSFFFQLYTGSKLFCFKLLCLHQFSSLLTAILHFVLLQRLCHLGWGAQLCPVVRGLELAEISGLPSQSPQPVPGHWHPAWCGDTKVTEGSSCLAGGSPVISAIMRKLTCEDWALPHKRGWISEQAGPTADTHTATRAHVYLHQSTIFYFTLYLWVRF